MVLMPPLLHQHRGCHGFPCPRQNRELSKWWPVRPCVPTEPTLMEYSPLAYHCPPQPYAFPHSLSVIVLPPALSVIGLSRPSFPFFLEPFAPVFLSSLQSIESIEAAHLLLPVLLSRSSLHDPSLPSSLFSLLCVSTVSPALCRGSQCFWKLTPGVDDKELGVSREAQVSGQSYLLSLTGVMASNPQNIT